MSLCLLPAHRAEQGRGFGPGPSPFSMCNDQHAIALTLPKLRTFPASEGFNKRHSWGFILKLSLQMALRALFGLCLLWQQVTD